MVPLAQQRVVGQVHDTCDDAGPELEGPELETAEVFSAR
eukprot:CAMPEP_0203948232 /NCGR_PEP_ID=MMETSP0359-20131031/82954_1 /ASSEMBLY_ACC=CAM_ASM_000338 /TAXON_ID=268821 /ORGANISM="Scrippsiella Hangoei, Strain SHTV-5" /LENGTH=38 /DNA_ID= /DNA_START= /DNA_END= /DNA_ORIENTATION=